MTTCKKCRAEKDISSFSEASIKNYAFWCRPCVREYNKKYYETPTGRKNRLKSVQKWRGKNIEKVKEYARSYTGHRRLQDRFFLLRLHNFTCVYCGRKSPEVSLQIDHIVPKSKGGKDELGNLTVACRECNIGKCDFLLSNNKPT